MYGLHDDSPLADQFQAIWREQWRIMVAALGYIAVYFVLMVPGGVYVDISDESGGPALLFSVVSISASYVLLIGMIARSGISEQGLRGSFWAYFGVAIVTGLATFIGFLLLVVPGIVLLVRWAPAYGYTLVEKQELSEALSNSWKTTGPYFWPILCTLLLTGAVMGGGMIGYMFFAFDDAGEYNLTIGVLTNALTTLGGAAMTAWGLAVYSLVKPDNGRLPQIFE